MAEQVILDNLNQMVESYVVNSIRESHPDIDVAPGSVIYDLMVSPLISILGPLIDTINENELAMDFVNYKQLSDTDDNDVVGEKGENNYFVKRRLGTKATGTIAFQVTEIPKNTSFTIPQGILVATSTDIRFRTTTTFEISAAEAASLYNTSTFLYDIPVPAEAEEIGSFGNVEAKAITEIKTPFSSRVVGVTNYVSFSGGSDREGTSNYLSRIMDFYTNNFVGTIDGYRNLILSERNEVKDMYIAGFRDKYMFRDKGSYVAQDGTQYEGNIGGKVDIYIKGEDITTEEVKTIVTNGRKKLAYKNVSTIEEWAGRKTVLISSYDKDEMNGYIDAYEGAQSDTEKTNALLQMAAMSIPHDFYTYPNLLYTWVKFADNRQGLNMSDDPTDKRFIGIAIEKETPEKSNNRDDYTWFLINNEKAIQMPTDEDGRIRYLWIKYADDVYGTNMDDIKGDRTYMGIALNRTSTQKSYSYEDYDWIDLLNETELSQGLLNPNQETKYHYIEVSDSNLEISGGDTLLFGVDLTLYYFHKAEIVDDEYGYIIEKNILNSEDFRVEPMGYNLTGPIVNPMISLKNEESGFYYDVLNQPTRFYQKFVSTPACPPEDKLTYRGTVLESTSIGLVKEELGFNGDTVTHTYTKNKTIADIDTLINEEANRIITTDVLVRPAGVKYVNIKLEVKPEDGVVLNDELNDRITKVISDRIDSLQLGEALDESDIISDLYAGNYTVKDLVDYIKLPFKSMYAVKEDELQNPIVDGRRGDFAEDIFGYDITTQFVDGSLPIRAGELQYIKLNKLQIDTV